MDMRKPDLLCIGAQKAGTTWLHYILSQHPKVWVPPFKEVHFFDHKFTPNNKDWTGWHIDRAIKTVRREHLHNAKTLDREFLLYLEYITGPPWFNKHWYQTIFAPAGMDQTALDVTPEYSCISEKGIKFVKHFLPNAKFIYIIRNPIERAHSQFRMQFEMMKRKPSNISEWEQYIADMELYSKADYARYIPLWKKHFKDRVLFLPFKEIHENPEAFLTKIEDFAGLPSHKYNFKNQTRNASNKKNPVPSEVNEIIGHEMMRQYDFLHTHFGADFAEKC